MGRPVVHWELMSNDPAQIAAFYETVFDWKIQHIPDMNYRLVETGGQGWHQRRHSEAGAGRTLAGQHALLRRRG